MPTEGRLHSHDAFQQQTHRPRCVWPAVADEGRRADSKRPSRLDEANTGNLDLPDPLSTTASAKGSRALSKLLQHGIFDCLPGMVEGDWRIRMEPHSQGIKVPGAVELRPNVAGPLLESKGGTLTARTSSMAGRQSQQRRSKGFANTARGIMGA